ncbi:MAG: 2'-5' RNA ligase family protein [Bacteroidota bacterium]
MGQQLSLFEKPNLVEYLFLVSPPDQIQQDILQIKGKIHSRIPLSPKNLKSKAHISLVEFPQMNRTEMQIVEKSGKLFKNMQPFELRLEGFGFFHHGRDKRTVYLQVKDSGPIRHVYTSLVEELKLKNEKFTPHLTVAKSIRTTDLEKIEDDLLNYDYSAEFICGKITLLKKESNDDFESDYQLVAEFHLES